MFRKALAELRGQLLLVFMALMFEVSFNALVPLSLRYMIDNAIGPANYGALVLIIAVLAAGALLATGAGFLRDYSFAEIQSSLLGRYRKSMFEHLQRLSIASQSKRESGEILNRFSGDLAAVENATVMAIPWALLPGLEALLSTGLLFLLNWKLAALAMIIWPWTLVAPQRISKNAEQAAYLRKEHESTLLGRLGENLAAQLVIKAFNLRPMVTERFSKLNADVVASTKRASFLSLLMERCTASGILLNQVAVLGLSGYMAFTGKITTGTLVSFQALLLMLSNSLLYVMQYAPSFVQAKSSLRRIQELLEEPESDIDEDGATEMPAFNQMLSFRDVSFSYTGKRQDLREIDIRIPKGSSVAFVGGSGSGKSTALSLLMRFYDASSGSIYVDEMPIRSITRDSFRSQLGVVFQESFLFNTSIRENIRIGKINASDSDVERASRAAEIHEAIMAMPDGYDTVVGDRGGRLSGGQRQRISIARAIVRDPSILLLDEATSALDPLTEALINATLAKLSSARTVVSVTHRLTSVVRFDRIVVFDSGRVVESGTHEALLSKGGSYARLWAKQSGFEVAQDGSSASIDVERLKAIPILSELTDAQLQQIAAVFVSNTYHRNATVFEEGDTGDKFYIIVRGRFRIVRDNSEIAVLEDGDCFGEIALVKQQPRNATVQSLGESLCLSLDQAHFQKLLADSSGTKRRLEELVSTRLLANT